MSSQECEHVRVFGRVRPSTDEQQKKVIEVKERMLELHELKGSRERKPFEFDSVFGEDATQERVFDVVADRVIRGCLVGYNGTIFAYGQTGSGKTHTMIGPSSCGALDAHQEGIIPRTLRLLFEELLFNQRQDGFQFIFNISFVELYNENIYDLLLPGDKLKLGVDSDGSVSIKGVVEEAVTNVADSIRVVQRGWANRAQAETAMNRTSSRSHALLIIKLKTMTREGGMCKERSSILNLVDLAGSERVAQSKAEGERFREATLINKSLTVLGRVIRILSDPATRKDFVPYRESALTHLLKDSLGGNSRTAVMINVHPDFRYYTESLSTLLFAKAVRMITNTLTINEDLTGEDVAAYTEEIRKLGQQLEGEREKARDEAKAMEEELGRWKEKANALDRQLAALRSHSSQTTAPATSPDCANDTLSASYMTPKEVKKERRRTRFTPAHNRQSTAFRPVLAMDEEGNEENRPVLFDLETECEQKEMKLEMEVQMLTQKLEEKTNEAFGLERILREAEARAEELAVKTARGDDEVEKERGRRHKLEEERARLEHDLATRNEQASKDYQKNLEMQYRIDDLEGELNRREANAAVTATMYADRIKELEARHAQQISAMQSSDDSVKNGLLKNLDTYQSMHEKAEREKMELETKMREARLEMEQIKKENEEKMATLQRTHRPIQDIYKRHSDEKAAAFASKFSALQREFAVKNEEADVLRKRAEVSEVELSKANENLQIAMNGERKDKMHVFERYRDQKYALEQRVQQLTKAMSKAGVEVPPETAADANSSTLSHTRPARGRLTK